MVRKLELGVAYYGNIFPDRAKDDLLEMEEHGCNSILIAMSEYDWEVWKNNIYKIAEIAKHDFDFSVYINLWSWGGVFGGEAPSFFLHRNVDHRQILSSDIEELDNQVLPAACFNDPEFQKYILNATKKIAKKEFIDGFFWDEPHFHYIPKSKNSFTCKCQNCQESFKDKFGKDIPKTPTIEIKKFKEESIIRFLRKLSQEVKKIDQNKKNIVCLVPPPLETGISDWDMLVKSLKDFIDVFSSDPYWLLFGKSLKYVEKYTKKTVTLAQKYDLESQLWLLGFLVGKNKEDELKEAVRIFDNHGVDSIFTWCYRGAEGMSLASSDPKKVWEAIGESYNNLKNKYKI